MESFSRRIMALRLKILSHGERWPQNIGCVWLEIAIPLSLNGPLTQVQRKPPSALQAASIVALGKSVRYPKSQIINNPILIHSIRRSRKKSSLGTTHLYFSLTRLRPQENRWRQSCPPITIVTAQLESPSTYYYRRFTVFSTPQAS